MIYRLFGFGLDVGRSTLRAGIVMGGVHADTHETILSDRVGRVAGWLRSEPLAGWHRSFGVVGDFAPTDGRADVALCKA
jgi:hypothetical protein